MKHECHRISECLSQYLDGELTPEQAREVEGHLEQCANCGPELARLREIGWMLHGAAAVPEAPDQWPQIRQRLQERVSPVFQPVLEEASIGPTWKRWMPLAAAVSVMLGVSLFWPFGVTPTTDVEPYLGLYLLAGTVNDVLSSRLSAEEIAALDLDFPTYLPPAVNGWERQGVYVHRLHGQPVLQIFYSDAVVRNYCIFQQSSRHSLDFGNREIQKEFVRNQVCTKFADRHFNLISWRSDKTLFTVVSTDTIDRNQIAALWIEQTE